MFTDLVGSTELASSLDPEDWHEVLDAYQHLVARVVAGHGGVVTQFQGDGVVAYFGYPAATETAGPDALAAGIDVVRAVEEMGPGLPPVLAGTRLRARAGIHTGVALVAEARAGGVVRPADVFGELPSLAARLQGAAEPGQVVVSGPTASLAEGLFDLQALPPLELKGIARPVSAFRVLRRNPLRSRLEAGTLAGFVPRTREWRWLQDHWRSASAGRPARVMIAGEPGIGKSRLALEFAAAIAASGARVVVVHCNRAEALIPLQPFGPVMGSAPGEPAEVVAWLQAEAGGAPLLLTVDDAHWADPSTLEVADRMVRGGGSVLAVLTARPQVPGSAYAPPPVSHHLLLDRLSPDAARSMVRLVPGGADLPRPVVEALVERADGVPLYLEELTRSVCSRPEQADGGLPATLTEVITARLDRLGEARRVAQVASVIGREFDPSVLPEVAGLDEQQVASHLRRLADDAIVDPPGSTGATLWFRHALIQETAYASLLRADRRRLHSLVADALAPGAPPQVVALHLGAAGRPEDAVRMWRRAARDARRNSRFREAAGHEEQILQLIPSLPEDRRDRLELETRGRLAMCLGSVDQGDSRALAEAAAARDLARRLGDQRAVLDSYLVLVPAWQARSDYLSIDAGLADAVAVAERVGDPWYAAVFQLFAAIIRVWQGRLDDLDGMTGAFEATGMPLDAPLEGLPAMNAPAVMLRCILRVAAALAYWLTGDMAQAQRLAAESVCLAGEREVPPAQGVTCATSAVMAQLDGDRDRAAVLGRAAEQVPEDVATLQWRQWGAALRWWAGDRAAGEAEPPLPGPMLQPYFLALRADDERVPPATARALLDQALGAARSSGERFCEAEILRLRGRAALREGRRQQAAADLVEAAGTARGQHAISLEMKALTDLVALLGDGSAVPPLSGLVERIGDDAGSKVAANARAALAGFGA